MKEIYLDNAASTKPLRQTIEKHKELSERLYANPQSAHKMGREAKNEGEVARKVVAGIMGVTPEELVFTSGATESNNLAIQGIAGAGRGRHIITNMAEHPSVISVCKYLESLGYEISYIPINIKGQIDLEAMEKAIRDDTVLVSVMEVNNETGVVQDIDAIGRLIKGKNNNTAFHVDGVQGFCKHQDQNRNESLAMKNIDLYSASAHKIYGFKGSGVLYVKNNLKIKPLFYGGGHGLRPGTDNVIGSACFATSANIAYENMKANYDNAKKLKNRFLEKIREIKNVVVNGDEINDSPYILNISFIGLKGEVLARALEAEGIYVSTGSSCNSNKGNKNILPYYGIGSDVADASLRVSFSHNNTVDEIDYCCNILQNNVEFLRGFVKGRQENKL